MKLYEMPNVFVHLQNKEEYDEYMEMCEEVGWKWISGEIPTEANEFDIVGDMWIEVISSLSYYESIPTAHHNLARIVSFNDLKYILHNEGKTCLEFKEFHPYLVYVLLKNGATPVLCDGEVIGEFCTDDFLIRVVGKTRDFEVQLGVRDTFDRWANSVNFTFNLEINEEDAFETILNYIESRIRKIKGLYDGILLDFFNDPFFEDQCIRRINHE